MSVLKNSETIFEKYDLGLTKTKRGPASIHPNVSEGGSGSIATVQDILLIAILDQLITLNKNTNEI